MPAAGRCSRPRARHCSRPSAGLAIGTVAAWSSPSRWPLGDARDAVLPFAIAANAIPIIAIAPIFNAWFGVTNPFCKMMIAALLVFFPVMINVTRGLIQVEPSALELMRSYAATEWEVLRKVRFPTRSRTSSRPSRWRPRSASSAPSWASTSAGRPTVIGRVVVQSASSLRFDVTWAAILLGAVTGIAFYLVIVALERVLIPWHPSVRGEDRLSPWTRFTVVNRGGSGRDSARPAS